MRTLPKSFSLVLALAACCALAQAVKADSKGSAEGVVPDAPAAGADVKPVEKPDPFDFSNLQKPSQPAALTADVDKRIKVSVQPLNRGPVVDRVVEDVIVHVRAPGVSSVEVYIEPVDAPYGGRTIADPLLIGKSTDRQHDFPVRWTSSEPHRYVKLFAVCYNVGGQVSRSLSLDLGLGGLRLRDVP